MAGTTDISQMTGWATELLKKLIAIPSLSREESGTAALIESVLAEKNIAACRVQNNVWAANKNFNPELSTLLLNSHHDTVPPNKGYTFEPYQPLEKDGKIYGLGSNDAGGPLVALLTTFLHFYQSALPFNIVFAASAEEEVSGKNGMELLISQLPKIDMAIVGEPTQMDMAVAEKGLLVLDCVAEGKSGHAARDEGENALYKAIDDINLMRNFTFEKASALLGPVHLAVTSMETRNRSHNVVPDECTFVVDIRINERYTFDEVLALIRHKAGSEIRPRSLRLKPSFIPDNHPLVIAGTECGMKGFGSPTLSDMALMPFPAIKSGPGNSARSHIADEFIFTEEIRSGIIKYIELINRLSEIIKNNANEIVAKRY